MTKTIKNSSSPIYNWPHVLLEKALRSLATDGALDGVIHDRVIHCKKRVQVKGTVQYQNPKYVALVKHHIPNTKKVLTVKSGTQVIDRCWRFLKDRISRNQHSKAGSKLLRANLHSAQYEYSRSLCVSSARQQQDFHRNQVALGFESCLLAGRPLYSVRVFRRSSS